MLLTLTIALAATLATAAPRDDARPHFDRAVAAFNAGNVGAARGAIARAVAADPNWPLALALQGRIALAARDGAFAESRLRAAWNKGYKQADLRHLFANAFLLQGRYDAVLSEARFADIPPRYAAYAARMRAAARAGLGDRAGAGAELDTALRLGPKDAATWADVARFRLYGGNVDGASGAAARALALSPTNVDALVLSGNLVRQRYGLAAALAWYNRALAVEPGNLAALLERAATLGDLGRARDMLAATRAVLAVSPNNPNAFYLQAVMAARAGDWALARTLLYKVGNRMEDAAGPKLLAALADLAGGNTEQAIAGLRPLMEAQPDNYRIRALLGNALWRSGDDRGAIEVLRGLADRPDASAYVLTVIGRAFERQGDRVRAAGYLDRASAPVRGRATPFDGVPNRPFGGGVSIPYVRNLLATGRAGDAMAEAQRIVQGTGGSPAALVMLGDTLGAQGRWADAAAAYTRAANGQFDEATALRLIDALRRQGDIIAATRVLEVFRAQNPQNNAAALMAADVFLAASDWARAAALLEDVRGRIGDRDATLLNNLGWARLGLKQTAQAAALGRAAYALTPMSAPVTASTGWFLVQNGERARGIALLKKAVALAPGDSVIRTRLAEAKRST